MRRRLSEIQTDSSLACVDYCQWIKMERYLSHSISISLLWVRSVIKRALHEQQAPAQDVLAVVTLSRVCPALCQKSAIQNQNCCLMHMHQVV